jgi:hypothetical protein
MLTDWRKEVEGEWSSTREERASEYEQLVSASESKVTAINIEAWSHAHRKILNLPETALIM